MIGYVMVGTNDLKRAETFYNAVLPVIGMQKHVGYSSESRTWYAPASGLPPMFVVTKTYDGNAATIGNGSMVALSADSRELVNKAHAKALDAGGTDEGAPGLRGAPFYGAYFRDLDGNKLAVFTVSPN